MYNIFKGKKMISIPIADGKNKFTYYVHKAEEGETVEIQRHGKPVAIICSVDSFKNVHKDSKFYDELSEARKEIKLLCDDISDDFLTKKFNSIRSDE